MHAELLRDNLDVREVTFAKLVQHSAECEATVDCLRLDLKGVESDQACRSFSNPPDSL